MAKTWKPWTKEEDALLLKIMVKCPSLFTKEKSSLLDPDRKFGERLRVRYGVWPFLAHYFFPGRSAADLGSRWRRTINPTVRHGMFSKEEDEYLASAAKDAREKFKLVATALKMSRSAHQLRTR